MYRQKMLGVFFLADALGVSKIRWGGEMNIIVRDALVFPPSHVKQIEGYFEGCFCFETDTMVRYQSQNAFLRDALTFSRASWYGKKKRIQSSAPCIWRCRPSPLPSPLPTPLKVAPQLLLLRRMHSPPIHPPTHWPTPPLNPVKGCWPETRFDGAHHCAPAHGATVHCAKAH